MIFEKLIGGGEHAQPTEKQSYLSSILKIDAPA